MIKQVKTGLTIQRTVNITYFLSNILLEFTSQAENIELNKELKVTKSYAYISTMQIYFRI